MLIDDDLPPLETHPAGMTPPPPPGIQDWTRQVGGDFTPEQLVLLLALAMAVLGQCDKKRMERALDAAARDERARERLGTQVQRRLRCRPDQATRVIAAATAVMQDPGELAGLLR